jgi:hypothetical protein
MQIEFFIQVEELFQIRFAAKVLQGKNTIPLFKETSTLKFSQVLPGYDGSIRAFELSTRYASHQDCKIIKLKDIKGNIEKMIDALGNNILISHRPKGGLFYLCKEHFSKENTHVNASLYLGEFERFRADIEQFKPRQQVPPLIGLSLPQAPPPQVDVRLVDGACVKISPSIELFTSFFSRSQTIDFSKLPYVRLDADEPSETFKFPIDSFSCTSLAGEQLCALAQANACLALPINADQACLVLRPKLLDGSGFVHFQLVPSSRVRFENADIMSVMSAELQTDVFFKGDPHGETTARTLYEKEPNFFACCRLYSLGQFDYMMSMYLSGLAISKMNLDINTRHAYSVDYVEQRSVQCMEGEAVPFVHFCSPIQHHSVI